MGDLTTNFSRHEFKCPCCNRLEFDPLLVDSLQDLRTLVRVPITITSGYRCERHNKAVHGEPHSYHMSGLAADIVIAGMTPIQMLTYAEEIPAFVRGGIGVYPQNGFIHVDTRSHKARWAKIYDAMVSIPYAIAWGDEHGTK